VVQVQPDCLFKLLMALEKDCPDNLGVVDLVTGDKPLKALVSSNTQTFVLSCAEIRLQSVEMNYHRHHQNYVYDYHCHQSVLIHHCHSYGFFFII
jgi:hypothetical protein